MWPLRNEIRAALEDDSKGLIVNLEDVSFLDSTGSGVLVGAYKRAAMVNAPFHIVCTHERIWKGFRVTGLDKAMNVHASMPDALSAVAVEQGWLVNAQGI